MIIKATPKMVNKWRNWLKKMSSRSSLKRVKILIGGVTLLMTSTIRVYDYREEILR